MAVRFIHTADLHLGSPLQAVAAESSEIQERIHRATYDALEAVVDAALDQEVDFVIFAGDVFDRESRSVHANRAFVDQLQRLSGAGVRSYIAYGNHDPLGDRGELFRLPDGCHVFGHEEVETFPYPDADRPAARILGQSYQRPAEPRKMYTYFTPPDDGIPNIGVLHTGLDPDSRRYVPCSLADLRGKDAIHYWALGHVHTRRVLPGSPAAVYPGIPQGRHINEAGPGGCVLVTLEAGEEADLEFVPAGRIVWSRRRVPVDELDPPPGNLDELLDALRDEAEALRDADVLDEATTLPVATDGWSPDGHLVRWVVEGRGPIHAALEDREEASEYLTRQLRQEFGRGSPFVWTEAVRLRTGPPLSELDEVAERDPVLQELLSLVETARTDPGLREDLRQACGKIWYAAEDPEDVRDDAFPLTDDVLDELLEQARDLMVERILERRGDDVDS